MSAHPRVLFISNDSSRTGAPIGLLAFVRWVRANTRADIGIILRTPGPLESEFKTLGPTVVLGTSLFSRTRLGRRIRHRIPHVAQSEMRALHRLVSGGNYDAIYSNTATNGALLEMLAGYRKPVVTHVHELDYWLRRSGPKNLEQVTRHTSRYIAAAQAVRENLVVQHGIAREAISVIYEHIRELPRLPTPDERAQARARLGIPPDAFVIGGCGAEPWRKGRDLIPHLLLALRRLAPARPVDFVWIGRPGLPDEEQALRYDLERAGVHGMFHATGETPNPFLFLPALQIFALLSRDDPYPLAALEGAALECPVLCFANAGGMPEFVGSDCGRVAPYLDVDIMAAQALSYLNDPAMLKRHGHNARAKVARENLVEITAPKLYAQIEMLLRGAAAPARTGGGAALVPAIRT